MRVGFVLFFVCRIRLIEAMVILFNLFLFRLEVIVDSLNCLILGFIDRIC